MAKRTAITVVLVAILTAAGAAQPPAPAIAPPVIRSPEVGADARVTFRIAAPNAKSVTVGIEGSPPRPMQRDEKGVWTVTTEPLEPDYYGYSFTVDGSRVLDSSNAGFVPNLLNPRSLLHVPGAASLPWEMNDVPHGTVHRHTYKSSIGNDARDLYVYTPPGYDAAAATRYPVLYLLHGFSDDASAWTAVGRANVILDNLIARGAARPMIVAMPLGYGVPEIVRMAVRDEAIGIANVDRFRDMMSSEIIPHVERSYRAATDPASRAIAGLSMGGSEALHVGLNHVDRFTAVGAFSAGVRPDFGSRFPQLTASANAQLRTLWIACGTADRLFESNRAFRDWLTTKQIRFTAVDTPGGHTWMVWRRNLAAFAPLLFKTGATQPTEAARDSKMTQSEQTELVDLLLESEREFMQEIEGLNERQWSFKPGPDRWSVGEVVEHIVLADAMLFDTATKSLTAQPDAQWDATLSKTDTLRRALPNRSRRVDAPGAIQPKRAMTREQLLSRFMEQRAHALKYARETDAPLKAHTAANPFFGSLNAHQWLLYIPLHHLRHNQQIVEVKASAGYPR